MKILGVGCAFEHDPSAALLVDGKIVAAADEERFSRHKHAVDELPVSAIRYCLDTAGIEPGEIDAVAYPWSFEAYARHRWRFFRRNLRHRTSHAIKAILKSGDRRKRTEGKLHATLEGVGIDPERVEISFVEHHLAHASSSYHLSGFPNAAILTVDGKGEFTTTLLAEGEGTKIRILREFINPDSLGLFYAMITDYLGFRPHDGEFKVMGMSPYGDPGRVDVSDLVEIRNGAYRVREKLVWVTRSRRYEGRTFSRDLVDRWGPPRQGDGLSEPYVHVAAAAQRRLEAAVLSLVEHELAPALERTDGRLAFAGGCALNVRLNRKLIEHPRVSQLWVQPAAHDAGTSLGAATWLAAQKGVSLEPMLDPYLGPSFDDVEIETALAEFDALYEKPDSIVESAAELLADGRVVGWFQGRMEWGPRALGNRSILAHPARRGIADDVNRRIKFREVWRPFCPSILGERSREILASDHESPFMTFSFQTRDAWKERIAEVVHVDGTCRPQIVTEDLNPLFYRLLKKFESRTGLPVLLNTSLNRRGEPMVCTPRDALEMFYGSGLEHLALGPFLVRKPRAGEGPKGASQ